MKLSLRHAIIFSLCMLPAVWTEAASLYWSGDGTSQGGAGTWNTSSARWSTTAGGPFSTTWNNANLDTATFDTVAAAVSVGVAVNVNMMTVSLSGFTFSGSKITFAGAGAGMNTPYTSGLTTFDGTFGATNFLKLGAGRIEMNNSGQTISKYNLKGGFLTFAADNRLGTAPGSLVQDYMTFDGGGIGVAATGFDMGTTRGITIGTGGAFFGAAGSADVIAIRAPIVGTNGGALRITTGAPFYSPYNAACVLLLSNPTNNYDGATTISSGALKLGASGVLPDTTTLTLSGGDLDILTNSDTIAKLVLSSSSSAISATGGGGSLIATNGFDVRSGTCAAVLAGAGVVLTKTTSGSVDITAANTFSGGVVLSAGTLRVNNNAGLGAAGSPVSLANGVTLSASSTTARTLNYAFTINGGIILGQPATAPLNLAGSVNLGAGTRQIQIDLTNTISATITNGGLTKTGTGILSLTATNGYTGPTTVSTGQLIITPGNNSGGSYTVSDFAKMTMVTTGAVATLPVSDMTFGLTTLEYDFARSGSIPATKIVNDAGAMNVNNTVTVDIKNFNTVGIVSLIEYAGPRAGAGSFVPGAIPPHVGLSLLDDTINNKVVLNVTNADSLIWVSDVGGNWDVNNLGNQIWKLALAGTPSEYQQTVVQGDTVRFDDTATGTTTVTVNATVTPYLVTVDNSSLPYSFTGVGKITGATSLTKNGTGTLVSSLANDYSGGTIANGGIIGIGNNTALGTGRLTVNAASPNVVIRSDSASAWSLAVPATLNGNVTIGDVVNNGDLTFTGIIGGAGAITKVGSGAVSLTGANTFTGGFNLNAGAARVNNNTSLGAANGLVSLANGVELSTTTTTARTLTYAFNVNGDLILGQAAGGTAAVTMAGSVNLTGGNRTFSISNATDTISAVITNGGLIKNGSGILALTGNNAYAGDTTITEGLVSLNGTVVTPFGNGAGTLNWVNGGITVTADRGTTANNIVNPINQTGNFELQAQTTTGTRNLVFGGVLGGSGGTLTVHNVETTNGAATLDVRFTNSFTFNRPIALVVDTAGNSAQLSIWNRADLGDQNYSGIISGNGSIRRSITTANTGGRSILSGDNTYSGGTSLNDGEIALGSDCVGAADAPTSGPLGTGTVTMNNDAGKLSAFGAARNLKNHILFSTGGKNLTLMGANDLELSGNVDLAAQSISFTNNNAGACTISGVITNGALVKQGAGTLTLTANSVYTGGTTINAGKLVVNGSLASTNITVNAGGTLGGTGLVAKVVGTAAGSVGAGNSVGTLTVTNGLDLSAGGTNVWELAANSTNNAGVDFDQIVLSGGNLALGGTSRLLVKFIGSATFPDSSNPFWQTAHQWKVISLTGTAVNTGSTTFSGVDGAAGNNAGTFSTSADGSGNIILQFTPGAPLPPPPVINPFIAGAGTGNAIVSWSSVSGASYTVQYKTNLNQVGWINLTNITATGSTTSIADQTVPVPQQRFYRVISP